MKESRIDIIFKNLPLFQGENDAFKRSVGKSGSE
jgi:hypothetical protein